MAKVLLHLWLRVEFELCRAILHTQASIILPNIFFVVVVVLVALFGIRNVMVQVTL